MVSLFERSVAYTSLACLYTWGYYKYNSNVKTVNESLFQTIELNARKYMENNKDENVKFLTTMNKKIIFLVGVENNIGGLRKLRNLNNLTENFLFDHMMFEKHINHCYSSLTNNLEIICQEIKTDYDPDENNVQSCNKAASLMLRLPNNDMHSLFKKINLNKNSDFFFNFFCIIAELKRNELRNCKYLYVGQPYSLLYDIINRYFSGFIGVNSEKISDDKTEFYKKILSIDEYKKLSIRERLQINKDQFDINSSNSIYEDLKIIIENKIEEIKHSKNKIFENPELIYKKFVINDFDEYICKTVLDNSNIFTGLIIVRKERLDDLYEKLMDYNKNI